MDGYELRKMLGDERFEIGSRIASSGKVGDPVQLGNGISTYLVKDGGSSHTVLRRVYEGGEVRPL